MNTKFKTVDEYIASLSETVQLPTSQIRQAIRETAPKAEETISYQMPAYRQNGILVYFAAFKNHIGFFPTAGVVEAFKDKLMHYQTSKGTIRFPLNEPLPLELVKEIVRFRVKQNLTKAKPSNQSTSD